MYVFQDLLYAMPMTCCVVEFFDFVFSQNNHHGSKRSGRGGGCLQVGRIAGRPALCISIFDLSCVFCHTDFTGSSIELHYSMHPASTHTRMRSLHSGGRGLFSDRFHSSPRCELLWLLQQQSQDHKLSQVNQCNVYTHPGAAGGRTGGPYQTPCSNSNPGRKGREQNLVPRFMCTKLSKPLSVPLIRECE